MLCKDVLFCLWSTSFPLNCAPREHSKPSSTAAPVLGCSLIRTSHQKCFIHNRQGAEREEKRLQTVSEEQCQHPPFFTRGGHRVVAMVGLGVMLKGISVLSELRSRVLLSGLGQGQVVKNIMMLLSAETLTADSFCRSPPNPAPSFPGWM